ncbi:flagellar basal body P-ring protein [Salmonella enterica subsp. enterica serovar Choleraesuis str. 0006]|nr:flagellar basal body P-ring protein [Salmonella enterica subsp. enterica serovar Choleraesuis str. 0006]
MLSQLGITVPTGTNMQLKNVAAVMVTASYPPFARQGQTIDVVVSSMGNAKSLRGGTLLMTPLKGVDSQVYALAQGNILVGGVGASAGGSSVQVNQLNGGRITNGAIIERELPTQFGAGNTINLQLNDEDLRWRSKLPTPSTAPAVTAAPLRLMRERYRYACPAATARRCVFWRTFKIWKST